jgi:hypothetical protein
VVAVHGPSGSWGVPTQPSSGGVASSNLTLGLNGGGKITAAVRQKLANGRHTLAVVRRAGSNGIWGSPEDVTGSDITSDVFAPQLAFAPNGSAVIAFQYVHHAAPGTLDVNAVTRIGANGTWTAPGDLAVGGASSAPQAVRMAPKGRAFVLSAFQGTNSAARSRRHRPDPSRDRVPDDRTLRRGAELPEQPRRRDCVPGQRCVPGMDGPAECRDVLRHAGQPLAERCRRS